MALGQGHCPRCGESLVDLPRAERATRTGLEPFAAGEATDELATVELSPGGVTLPEAGIDPVHVDPVQSTVELGTASSELPDGSAEKGHQEGPVTVQQVSDQTMDFSNLAGASAEDDEQSLILVTSHWQESVEKTGEVDPLVTIKLQETVAGSGGSSSSLIVKSRQVRSATRGAGATTPAASATDAPDYELLDVIGEGGMGVVYAAKQSSIARTVAVKMLKGDDKHTLQQRDKFISEAVITGELEHPNIVPVYDLGSNDEGALFYSMKRVRGTPWNKVIEKKALDENLNILLRTADAIAFAHANGVVHRDLKPENVMLGDYGEVLVMDWGLARISPEFPHARSVSQSDVMGGTPAYMAPEMATGPIDRITPASDIYLLGAILFEIVSGRPPHSGKTVMACLLAAAKNQIAATGHSGELLDIALRALATQPAARYRSVLDFQDALRQYQAHSESIVLAEHAARNLQRAHQQNDYDLFARAVYGLQEALALWKENRSAAGLLSQASADYARSALAKGDLDLGISLLEPATAAAVEPAATTPAQPELRDPRHRELYEQLLAARRERESRQRRLRLLKGLIAALVCAVVGIVSVAYVAVRSQRNEAITQRDRAVVAEGEATHNYQAAEAARQVAETEKQRAETQRRLAVEAKQAETYEAYVARIGLAKAKIDENSFDRALELLDQCPPPLRQWEWGRLTYLCRLSRRSWQMAGPVDAVAFSPDGSHFACGAWDGKARIGRIDRTGWQHTFAHGQYVHAVAFDAQGERLATGSSDHTIRIYQTQDGKLLATLKGHTDAVLSVRFSPDGHELLSSGYDNTARLWDLDAGECRQVLRGHGWWVWSAEFSATAEQIVTAGQDGKAIVWQKIAESGELRAKSEKQNAESGERRAESGKRQVDAYHYEVMTEFTQHRGPVYVARFSPSGLQVATGGYDRRVLLWDPRAVEPVDLGRRLQGLADRKVPYRQLLGHKAAVRALAFTPDGLSLASGGEDNRLCVWDLGTGALRKTLRGHASGVRSCEYSPRGYLLLSGGQDAQIKLWEPETYAPYQVLGDGSGHADAVLDAHFSHDSQQVVTASRDRTAAVWEVATGRLQQQFEEGHEFLASTGCFYADGSRLATGAGDGTVRIWDVATGGEIHKLASTGRAAALDVSRDGRLLVTGGPGDQTQVWDARSGRRLAVLAGDNAPITAARFAPEGRLLATGDERGRCQLWHLRPSPAAGDQGSPGMEGKTLEDSGSRIRQDSDLREGGRILAAPAPAPADHWLRGHRLLGHSRAITALAFLEDRSAAGGVRLVTASGDNTCGQWNVATGREIPSGVLKHPDWVNAMAVVAAGSRALTSCEDGRLRLWSLTTGKLLQTYEPPAEKMVWTSVDLDATGHWALAVCAARRTVMLWPLDAEENAATGPVTLPKPWLDFRRWGGLVWSARFAPGGRQVLTLGGNDARLWQRKTGAGQVRFSPHGAVASVDLSADGRWLVTGSWDRSAKIWNLTTGRVTVKLDGLHSGYVNSVQFSPDSTRVLTASDDGTARLWDMASGKPLAPVFAVPGARLLQGRFQADGKRLLTVSSDRRARIWDVATGQMKVELVGHHWAVLCGQFSPDSRQVLTGSEDNRAILWDAVTGQSRQILAGHTGSVTAVAFSPDGGRLLTGSTDSSVKLWDAQTGKELLTLSGLREGVTAVDFSPDGLRVLGSGRDGQTILWPAAE